ncbi:hypothetical protein [Gordonia terrae]
MTVLDTVAPASPPYADVDAGKAPPTAHHDGRRSWRKALTAPREVSMGARYASTIGAGMLAFAPAIAAEFDALRQGSPTAYLLFVPLWCLMIAFGLDVSSRGREIGDGEFDRILVVVVGGALGLTAALVIPRIPAVAAFWHADLIPLLIWVFAASIAIFGIRRVVRDYLIWLFLLTCFPPNYLLMGQVLGGSTVAFGCLSVSVAVVVTFMALRRRPRVAIATAVLSGVVGTALVLVFQHTPVLAYTVPTAVVTASAIVVRLRFGRDGSARAGLPKQSVATLASAWLVALVILAVTPLAPDSPKPVVSPPIGAQWLDQLRTIGIGITEPQIFEWGPRVMGAGGDARRYRVTTGQTDPGAKPLSTAYLDVFSTADLGRFSSYRRGLWYETVPPATVDAIPASAGGQHTQIGSIANTLESVQTSDQTLWTGRFWGWRVPTPIGERYYAVYLMAARDQLRADDIVEPSPPSYSSAVAEPIGWLVRGGEGADGPNDGSALDDALTDLAWLMIDAVERPSR